jgi:hypothetical protein
LKQPRSVTGKSFRVLDIGNRYLNIGVSDFYTGIEVSEYRIKIFKYQNIEYQIQYRD